VTPPFSEAPPDDQPPEDGGGFSIDIDASILEAAVAAVDVRKARQSDLAQELNEPIDLDELIAVENELTLEIDLDFNVDAALGEDGTQIAEVRIRAMEAEEERDELKNQMIGLSKAKIDIEAKLNRLNQRATHAQASTRNAMEARQAAEVRAKRLKEALEKQQSDIEKLLDRKKKDTRTQYAKGRTDAVLTLVEVLDSLELALSHSHNDPTQVIRGVELAVQQFNNSLRRIGVVTVPAKPGSEFDPNVHEAITREHSSTVESGCIVEVISQGFTLDGRLIRAARVSVSAD
jgi:molecular chaperone GrpE